jgi:hypothetical protein
MDPRKKKVKPLNDRYATLQALELEYQNQLLEACNKTGMIYNSEVIEKLLSLLTVDPPFRSLTFRVICSVIIHLTFNKRRDSSPTSEHQILLRHAY